MHIQKTQPPQQHEATRVTSFNVAAYLLALDCSLVKLEGPRHQRTFVFTNVPEGAIVGFLSDTARVHPRKLLDAVRNLKSVLNEV